jgi:uncharacterized protein YecE (DUF72 family)
MIHVGTSGFQYKDWVGPFYPKGLAQSRWLEYYAERFGTCELNYTFYRMPAAAQLARMGERVPDAFRFAVKAFQGITHEREGAADNLRRFGEAMQPLHEQGKLAAILLQFPYSFRPDRPAAELLQLCRQTLEPYPLVAEFRNHDWLREETFDFLRRTGIGFCCVDEPKLSGLMPPIAEATGPVAYVRFHGRNAAKWWQHDEAWQRYDYTYRPEELQEWLPKLRALDEGSENVYVYSNNHWQGQAVDTATQLRLMLYPENG